MEYLKINPSNVGGIVYSSGSKNIALPLICASLLTKGKHYFSNVPDISDVRTLLSILHFLNVESKFTDGELFIDSSSLIINQIPQELVAKLRASYYLLGVLLPQVKDLVFSYPGGCSFQERPIDYHLNAFRKFGVYVEECQEYLKFKVTTTQASEITLIKKSVGATINILFFAIQIEGKTIINNPSLDFEVLEIINYLNKTGAYIVKEGSTIVIYGGKKIIPIKYQIPYDRIEVGSFALLGAALGRILIIGINKESILPLLKLFDQLNIDYQCEKNYLLVERSSLNQSIKITLSNDPFLPTDLGPILCAFLLNNKKMSIIEDKIYPRRNSYVKELNKMGANIKVINNKIIIFPNSSFNSSYLEGKDLRGVMGLILGSLISNKTQKVEGYFYLQRGYENILNKLEAINIDIRRINQ